jgi:hypothetical protein
MLKKLLEKKTLLTVVGVVIVILAAVIVGIVMNRDSNDTGKSGVSIGTEKDTNDTKENMDEENVYNGEGLEVMDEVDETVDEVDGSGSWDDTSKSTPKKEQDNATDDKEIDETEQDNSSNKENVDDVSDEEILVDDKIWGDIS